MATIAQALRLALRYAETGLGVTNIFGQDVGPPLGGVFTVTQGLAHAWNTPLDERGIIGTAAGLAMIGVPSVCEIQFGDYIFNTVDLLRLVGNTCWSTRGQFPMPMVLMTPVGAGIHGGIYHSHSIESLLTHLPGWKVVMPSNARDAYGLMVSAVLDGNPVAFLIPKALIRGGQAQLPGQPQDVGPLITTPVPARAGWTPQWPPVEPFCTAIGPLSVVTRGSDLTLLSYGRMLHVTREALQSQPLGERVELLDLRTLVPYDRDALLASVARTRRFLVVNEDSSMTNFGEHLMRVVHEALPATRMRLLAARHLPGVGLSQVLEDHTIPTAADILRAVEDLLAT